MLRPKQEKFIQNIIKGMSQRQAYKKAYNAKYSEKSIDEKASTLFNSEKVQERYQELLKIAEDESVMTAKFKRHALMEIFKNKRNNMNDRLKALDIDNKMAGEYVTNINGIVDLSYEETLKKVSEKDEY